jgi:putative SOS response-associated peptidase YedK
VPSWAKDISIGSRMINARCETVHEKPAFRLAIRTRRCIIPASGFFEWSATAVGKLPHYVTMRDDSPMAFAGIWEVWINPSGERIDSCAILTSAANSLVEPLHDRMPVILHHSDFDLWLDRTVNDPRKLQRLYQPFPSELMQMWEVSSMVNKPSQDTAENIAPVKASS